MAEYASPLCARAVHDQLHAHDGCWLTYTYLQKKRLAHDICLIGRSYLPLTKKSVTPRKPSWARMLMALSTALWKGGITVGV